MKRNQLKIDSFFTRSPKLADKNENLVNKDTVDLTVEDSLEDLKINSQEENQRTQEIRECRISCLSTFDELKTKASKSSSNLIEKEMKREKRKASRLRKPDEDEWFYMVCDQECEPDCDAHYKVDDHMANESEEKRKRIKFYRQQLKMESRECNVEYIFGFERVNGCDFYKVKWAGWPVESWTWVPAINCDHQPIDDFRRQLQQTLPRSKWPKFGQKNYKIPTGYEIRTKYVKSKLQLRKELDQVQARLREKDSTVLLENEEDTESFPKFNFITERTYHKSATPQLGNSDAIVCNEDQCGQCSVGWHHIWQINWDKNYPQDSETVHHYDREDDDSLTVKHGNTNIIIECTEHCKCYQAKKCTNQALLRLREHPLPFVIFKCETGKGWGLKCMRNIKKGEPVIEYIGERMALSEFHRREEQQEQKQSLYCVELTREDEHQEMFCVDSADHGNHARFINHSCGNSANLLLYRIIGAERHPNRSITVLFARRDIKIGEELTFDYKIVTEESIGDEVSLGSQVKSEKRLFNCLCKKCEKAKEKGKEKKENKSKDKSKDGIKKRKMTQSKTTPKSKRQKNQK